MVLRRVGCAGFGLYNQNGNCPCARGKPLRNARTTRKPAKLVANPCDQGNSPAGGRSNAARQHSCQAGYGMTLAITDRGCRNCTAMVPPTVPRVPNTKYTKMSCCMSRMSP